MGGASSKLTTLYIVIVHALHAYQNCLFAVCKMEMLQYKDANIILFSHISKPKINVTNPLFIYSNGLVKSCRIHTIRVYNNLVIK